MSQNKRNTPPLIVAGHMQDALLLALITGAAGLWLRLMYLTVVSPALATAASAGGPIELLDDAMFLGALIAPYVVAVGGIVFRLALPGLNRGVRRRDGWIPWASLAIGSALGAMLLPEFLEGGVLLSCAGWAPLGILVAGFAQIISLAWRRGARKALAPFLALVLVLGGIVSLRWSLPGGEWVVLWLLGTVDVLVLTGAVAVVSVVALAIRMGRAHWMDPRTGEAVPELGYASLDADDHE